MEGFSNAAMKDVNALFGRYPKKLNALLPLLHLAQRENEGWLPEGWDAYIAELCDTTVNHVRGVITFYNMYKTHPVGRNHLLVCASLPCGLCGWMDMLHALEKKLGIHPGQTSDDGLFSLEEAQCLAFCDKAPVLYVNDQLHEKVTEDDLDRIISKAQAERP